MHRQKVNVDETVSIGHQQLVEYDGTWPGGFHAAI